MTQYEIEGVRETLDVVSIGFGPAGIALACALEDDAEDNGKSLSSACGSSKKGVIRPGMVRFCWRAPTSTTMCFETW